ncbi:hypothetical protein BH11ACT6_BH11ACT6_43560 [soil metagenome]
MGMTGFLTVPMYFGAELVKITPMDFLSDILLWARLIDKYKGTMSRRLCGAPVRVSADGPSPVR